jgi:hypothetical protein
MNVHTAGDTAALVCDVKRVQSVNFRWVQDWAIIYWETAWAPTLHMIVDVLDGHCARTKV